MNIIKFAGRPIQPAKRSISGCMRIPYEKTGVGNLGTDGERRFMIRLYLDVCCLCRPFDDQNHFFIRQEADSVQ